jgi:hypothetical protein
MMLTSVPVADPEAGLAEIFAGDGGAGPNPAAEGLRVGPLARLSVNRRDERADKAKDAAPQM